MARFNFSLPPDALAGVKPFGQGGPPEAGYYACDIKEIETFNDHTGSLRLVIPNLPEYNQVAHELPERAEGDIWAFWNMEVPNPGNDPEIAKQNNKARKGQVTTLASIGYAPADIAKGPVSVAWLVPDASGVRKRCYVSYVPPIQGQKGSEQVDFIDKEKFLALKASGTTPSRRASSGAPAGATAPPTGGNYTPPAPPPAPATPTIPPTSNGGYAAPPPPPQGAGSFAPPPPPQGAGSFAPPPPPIR